MALSPGTVVGHYEIVAPLGKGGMGAVYRARDTRLNRDVALKVLLEGFTAGRERLARFAREARTLASLNHPNIVQIYGLEPTPDGDALVMEYVEGPTLADRLSRGALRPTEALLVSKQLADALTYAHDHGIIHRDLKPANVKLARDGTLKVLDFGFAKRVREMQLLPQAMAEASTIGPPMTVRGEIFGTPGYMAPEQLRGQPADARSDVFAAGVVMFELLTGLHPFSRPTFYQISEAILSAAPPVWPGSASEVPAFVRSVVMKAIAKDPGDRYQSMAELRGSLEALLGSLTPLPPTVPMAPGSVPAAPVPAASAPLPPATPASVPVARRRRWVPGVVVGSAVIVAAGAVGVWFATRDREAAAPVGAVTHTQVTFTGDVRGAALSPDGRTIAYVVRGDGTGRVMVRDVKGGQALEIWRGELVVEVQWMPDGSQIILSGIEDDRVGVWIVPRLGGAARPLAGSGAHIAVSPDGSRVAMAFQNTPGFQVVPVGGGEPTRVAMTGFLWLLGLDWSAQSERLAVLTQSDDRTSVVWVATPDGRDVRRVYADEALLASIRWSPSEDVIYLLRARNESGEVLRIEPDGERGVVAEVIQAGLPWDPADPYMRQSSLSTDGRRLLYVRGFTFANLWRFAPERAGAEPAALTQGTSRYGPPRFSPDGEWLVASVGGAMRAAIVKIPATGGEPVPLTTGEYADANPAWSPDGRWIAFGSMRGNVPRVWTVAPDGRPPVEVPNAEVSTELSVSWTPDGRLAWLSPDGRTYRIRSLEKGREESLVTDPSVGWVSDPRFSPTGDRVAVWWNRKEAGLWLLSWPDRLERFLARGDVYPAGWSPDGRWIYAYESAGRVVARVSASTGELQPVGTVPSGALESCDVSGDGRSLVCSVVETKSDAWLVEQFDPHAPAGERE